MVTFRNNNRRNNFRRNGRSDRNFKNNVERTNKFNPSFSGNENFQRKSPGRNNHNAPKLIEKYNNLAREALSGGDKILSEKQRFQKILVRRMYLTTPKKKKLKQLLKFIVMIQAMRNQK